MGLRDQNYGKKVGINGSRIYHVTTLLYYALSLQISRIYQLLDENLASITTLEVERDCWDSLKDLFNEAQNAFVELIDNEEDKQESYHWFDIRDRECVEAKTRLAEKKFTLWNK